MCTAYYSLRTLSYAFGGTFRGGRALWAGVTVAGRRELPLGVVGALGVLVGATLFGEALGHPYLGAVGGAFLQSAGVAAAADPHLLFAEGVASANRLLPLLAMGVGFGLFGMGEWAGHWWVERGFGSAAGTRLRGLAHFCQRGWYFDGALGQLCFGGLRPLLRASLLLEKGLLEWVGPFGVGTALASGQRWLDLANLGRSVFGTLGLVGVAYGLLLAYTLVGSEGTAALGLLLATPTPRVRGFQHSSGLSGTGELSPSMQLVKGLNFVWSGRLRVDLDVWMAAHPGHTWEALHTYHWNRTLRLGAYAEKFLYRYCYAADGADRLLSKFGTALLVADEGLRERLFLAYLRMRDNAPYPGKDGGEAYEKFVYVLLDFFRSYAEEGAEEDSV